MEMLAVTQWWSPYTGMLIGAIGGSALGVLGGILGAASGIWANQCKHRSLVLGGFALIGIIGVLLLIGLGVALFCQQPYHVFYPMGLIGFISTCVMGSLYFVIRARYAMAEQRKINAASLRA